VSDDDIDDITVPPRWYGTNQTRPARNPTPTMTAGTDDGADRASTDHQPQGAGTATVSGDQLSPADIEEAHCPPLRAHSSVRQIAHAARTAFLSRDLVAAGPGLWPFGTAARARRDRNRHIAEEARRRRAQFREAFESGSQPPTRLPTQWRPVARRSNLTAIAFLGALVAMVFAVALYVSDQPVEPVDQPAQPAGAPPLSLSTEASSAVTPATSVHGPAVSARPPIPSGGVAPITPLPATPTDPGAVQLVDPPAGPPSSTELATPDGAMRAWLARLCPFRYSDPFGAAEDRARPAMTDTGWASVNPRRNDRARDSWQETVTAQEAARCTAPLAAISPEAPRSDASAIVLGLITRVVTAAGRSPYLEQISRVHVVQRGPDGWWRVDRESDGG
jgi:hypothetical protein